MKAQQLKFTLILLACFGSGFNLIIAQPSEFYGIISTGGENDAGTIFKTDEDGNNFQVISGFSPVHSGAYPTDALYEANNGKFYGMTVWGGANDGGVIFEWDPNSNDYIGKFDFDGVENGECPRGSFVQADNGRLYGTASAGGVYAEGVIFEWDYNTNTYTKKLDFDGGERGRFPLNLMKADNGKLYGVNVGGGAYNAGVLYEWDPSSDTYTKKLDFDGGENGRFPCGSLFQASNGKLYGMTSMGGSYGDGVIFEWDNTADTCIKMLDFNSAETGREPHGTLIQTANGKLYGMTLYGGLNNYGVLFEFDPETKACTKILDFDGAGNGRNPLGSLMQAENGKLYGTTTHGGLYNCGVLFELNPQTNTYSKKLDFNTSNRCFPNGALLESNGKLYGMASPDDINYITGFLFEWDPSTNTYTEKFEFNAAESGRYPKGTLVQSNNGKLYGLTNQGGATNGGVIFELDPATDKFQKKFDFTLKENGKWPYGSLIQADNGKLYGMASSGGSYSECCDYGVLFEWDPVTETYTKKLDFNGAGNGRFPSGSLVQASNGKLYGMTSDGGVNTYIVHTLEFGMGVLFEWDPVTDTYAKKLDFNGEENGRNPYGSLIQADNGKLYGMTNAGGTNDFGVLFEWDPSNDTYTKKLDFNGTENGKYPFMGSVIQATNGKLYGMTSNGGINDEGVLFEWDPVTDSCSKKIDFNGLENGSNPSGPLMQAEDGKLYGFTRSGGAYNQGILFSWDPLTNILIKKIDLGGTEKQYFSQSLIQMHSNAELFSNPNEIEGMQYYGSLKEVKLPQQGFLTEEACDSFISPSGKYIWRVSGEYFDTIPSKMGFDSVLKVNLSIRTVDVSVTQIQATLKASATGAVYQWVDCDNEYSPIEGETEQSYNATETGNYAVIVYQNGCIDTSARISVNITHLEDNTFKSKISLYPNPTNGLFTIDMGRTCPDAEISISQLDGRVIRKEHITNSRFKDLQLSESPGLYLVSVTSGNERAVFKLSKK